MDHTTRTIIFGVAAVVAISMAFATGMWTAPRDPDKFSDEGSEFYAAFTDPFVARAIKVAIYNEEIDAPEEFEVRYQDGVWRIPTHYNYPADGQDRLAKTATSVIGIRRDSLQSESREDHEELGVVDPLDPEITSGEGCGTRVTLLGEDDKELVNYIIGKQPDPEQERYYIRRADEERTYLAKVNIDLSTKFTDWIEPNLLEVERNDIVELYINDYSIIETPHPDGGLQISLEPKENVELTRESGGFQWTLEGIDDSSESLKSSVVNAMLTALDDLKIVGVRPKPEVLQAVLRGESATGGPLARMEMEGDLASKGFYLLDQEPGLISNEGALIVGTSEGINYQLLVGNVFVGSQSEIEIGGDDAQAEEETEGDAESQAEGEEDIEGEEELAPGEQRSRYLFILTSFDESLIEKPEPPVMPMPPAAPEDDPGTEAESTPSEEAAPTETEETDSPDAPESTDPVEEDVDNEQEAEDEPVEEAATDPTELSETPQCDDPAESDQAESVDEPTADDSADEPQADDANQTPDEVDVSDSEVDAADEAPAEDASAVESSADETADDADAEAPPAPTAEEQQAAYEAAMQDYEAAMRQYETDLEEYEQKVADGQEKVAELQDRFAEWYYVIPADVFEDLDVSRADLVEPKAADDAADTVPDFEIPPLLERSDTDVDLPELPDTPEETGAAPDESPDSEATEETPEDASDAAESDAAAGESPDAPTGETDASTGTDEASQSGETGESSAPTPESQPEPSTME